MVQVFSACVMSFAHGSNDIANAMGPFSGVYYIWETSTVPTKAPVRLHAYRQHAIFRVLLHLDRRAPRAWPPSA